MNELYSDKAYFRTDLPPIKVGDHVEISHKEGKLNSKRVLLFKGVVVSQKNVNRIGHTFTVLREFNKVAVSCVFSYNSPLIISIQKTGQMKVRRSKLYFLERKIAKKKENE